MKNKFFNRLFLIFHIVVINCCLSTQLVHANQQLSNVFPKLTARYGNSLKEQKAHYIFVVDVSSSMSAYENVEKMNLLRFVDSVPDDDQITIIRMASKEWTDYVGLFKCTTLNPETRSALKSTVSSPSFAFLQSGDSKDGSDGFKTASLIVDAINIVGSNDLTFIYLFTDFEYWTRQHRFDKKQEPWASLEERIPSTYRSGMCKFGIELETGQQRRPEAIFKPEMDKIFGKVSYLPVNSAAVLSQWFSHITADVMAAKMNAALKKEWNALMSKVIISNEIRGNEMIAKVSLDSIGSSPLISDVTVELTSSSPILIKGGQQRLSLGEEGTIGHFEVKKGVLPGWITLGDSSSTLKVTFHSEFEEEIDHLQKVCKDNPTFPDAVNLEGLYPLDEESNKVWGSIIPPWMWILMIVIILVIIASFVYEYLVLKTNHRWSASVKEEGLKVKCPAPDFTAPFIIGKTGDYPVPNANWTLKVLPKRYNPLLFWKKSGYYLEWEGGTATVKDQTRQPVMGLPSDNRLCTLKGCSPYTIEKGVYNITISCY